MGRIAAERADRVVIKEMLRYLRGRTRESVIGELRAGLAAGGMDARVITLTPGERPLEQLAMRLALIHGVSAGSVLDDLRTDPERVVLAARQALVDAPPDARLVLVVDQFEELFTLCDDDDRRRAFIDALLRLRCAVAIGVRADIYGRLSGHSKLALAVADNQVLLGPMGSSELERAITDETALVSVMWANNETGVMFPFTEIAEIVRSKGAVFHTDAVQVAGKVPLRVADIGVHLQSFWGFSCCFRAIVRNQLLRVVHTLPPPARVPASCSTVKISRCHSLLFRDCRGRGR